MINNYSNYNYSINRCNNNNNDNNNNNNSSSNRFFLPSPTKLGPPQQQYQHV